jgi:hypothetical protein
MYAFCCEEKLVGESHHSIHIAKPLPSKVFPSVAAKACRMSKKTFAAARINYVPFSGESLMGKEKLPWVAQLPCLSKTSFRTEGKGVQSPDQEDLHGLDAQLLPLSDLSRWDIPHCSLI